MSLAPTHRALLRTPSTGRRDWKASAPPGASGRRRLDAISKRQVSALALRLAATRPVYLAAQRVETDGAHNDIRADEVARRAVQPELVAERVDLVDRRLDLVALHVP